MAAFLDISSIMEILKDELWGVVYTWEGGL